MAPILNDVFYICDSNRKAQIMGPSTHCLVHYVSTSAPPVPTVPEEYVPSKDDVWFAPVLIVPPDPPVQSDPPVPPAPIVARGDNVLIIRRVAAPEHRTNEFVLPFVTRYRATELLETGKEKLRSLETASLPLGQELVFDPRNVSGYQLTLRESYVMHLEYEINLKKLVNAKDKRLKSYNYQNWLTYADAAVIMGVSIRNVQIALNTMRRQLSMEHLKKD